jgi:hypothetical protein
MECYTIYGEIGQDVELKSGYLMDFKATHISGQVHGVNDGAEIKYMRLNLKQLSHNGTNAAKLNNGDAMRLQVP